MLYHNEPMLGNTLKMREAGHSEARRHAESQGRTSQFSIRSEKPAWFPWERGPLARSGSRRDAALPGPYTADGQN